MVLLTTISSEQSMMCDTYTLPAGIWNSMMSVGYFSLSAAACKSWLMMFTGAELISLR